MNWYLRLVCTIAFAFAFQPAAKADTLTLYGLGHGGYGNVPLWLNQSYSINEYAVEIQVAITGPGGTQNQTAYCIDLFTGIGLSTYVTTPSAPSTLPNPSNGGRLAWLYEHFNNLGNWGAAFDAISTNLDDRAIALQLALWDVRHDNSGSGVNNALAVGNIQLANIGSPAVRSLGDTLIALSFGKSSNHATILYNATFGTPGPPAGNAQTLITSGNWDPPPAIPEPSTMLMMGAGLALFGVGLRRKRTS